MASRGVRIGIAGATGALGTEVLSLLDASRIPIAQLVAVAGERSLGCDIEFQGEVVAVATELPALHGLDLFVCCTPSAAAPDIARAALRAEVPCVDASGAFASRAEVPLVWAGSGESVGADPLVASPVDAALVWVPVLRALAAVATPVAVHGTVIEAASARGRAGIDALTAESLALFNQTEPPESEIGHPLAFDLHPTSGARSEAGREREGVLRSALARLLPAELSVSARWVQASVFVGQASSLRVAFARPVDAAEAADALAKAAGVELWDGDDDGPNLRAASGREVVLVARPESDVADAAVLHLWAVADVLRLAAANAVALATACLEARGTLDRRGVH